MRLPLCIRGFGIAVIAPVATRIRIVSAWASHKARDWREGASMTSSPSDISSIEGEMLNETFQYLESFTIFYIVIQVSLLTQASPTACLTSFSTPAALSRAFSAP